MVGVFQCHFVFVFQLPTLTCTKPNICSRTSIGVMYFRIIVTWFRLVPQGTTSGTTFPGRPGLEWNVYLFDSGSRHCTTTSSQYLPPVHRTEGHAKVVGTQRATVKTFMSLGPETKLGSSFSGTDLPFRIESLQESLWLRSVCRIPLSVKFILRKMVRKVKTLSKESSQTYS